GPLEQLQFEPDAVALLAAELLRTDTTILAKVTVVICREAEFLASRFVVQIVRAAHVVRELPVRRKEHAELAVLHIKADHNLMAVNGSELQLVRVWMRSNRNR